jgi:hypothetical protein
MHMQLFRMVVIGILIGVSSVCSAQAAEAQSPAAGSERPEPCYVVVAVDVSGSMERSDSAQSDSGPTRQTLRDEGQLFFMQMLPFLRSDLYLGVAHFSDRVRYSLPSADTGPLLPWSQTFLTESACRNMVRPAEFQATFRTDIGESMDWARARIAVARRQFGQGPGKLIVLTNGDPRDSARELDRGEGPLMDRTRKMAEDQIQIYPILINASVVRSSGGPSRLSADEVAAEDLMHSIASATGGKAYRLTRELGFADILMDVFGLGMQVRADDLRVGKYDWAIVTVGESVKSATVEPVGASDKSPRTLTMDGNLESASGIRTNVIVSPGYQTTILRRPEAGDFVDRFWQGKWKLGPAGARTPPAVRVYRIPDFQVQLDLTPQLPWWLHEQVQVKARLLSRHRKGPESRAAGAADAGKDLSIVLRATLSETASPVLVDKGRWTTPSRLYETEPFTLGTPGLYRLTCELRHAIGDANVPILQAASDVRVRSECVSIKVVKAATGEVLAEVPPAAGATVNLGLQGGQDVSFRIAGKGDFNVEPLSGTLFLEPLDQTDWTLKKDDQGNLSAGPVRLIEREERLVGHADLDVRTQAGVRHIRLPRFSLAYPPAPMRIECKFTDPREALWVGEFHKQPVVISAFPVFERFRDATMGRFPNGLAQARIRTVDMRSGTTQMTEPQSRVLEPPQAGQYQGRTVAATYFVESSVPIPSADKCEIELGPAMESLQGTTKTYAIVDPVAQGLFKWSVTQGGQAATRQGLVSETLFCGEPIQFHAEWRADQNISAVRFEFPQTDSNEPAFVDVPVTAGANKADVEQTVAGLGQGQTLPVYVHVTMRPAGADRELQVKLNAGRFRAEDRRVVLEDLAVGAGALTDIAAYAWEPVEIPLRVVFTGYTATDPRHNAAVEQFKKSCVVKITGKSGRPSDVSDTIEWTSVTSPEGPGKRCELTGRAVYMPDVPGRAAVEVAAQTPAVQGAGEAAPRRAYAHVLVKSPRLAVTIRKVTPTGDEPVFDSRRWSSGEGGVSAVQTRFSARLRVDIRGSDWAATGQSHPWRAAIRLLRRPAADAEWVPEFSDSGELTAEGSFLREVQTAGNGEYALEVTSADPQSGRRTAFFLTPVIASIRPHEIKPAVAPPAWLSSRVRQWPFEYLVTLYQEATDVSQSQALAFQFQLPGQTDAWMEGSMSPVASQTPQERLLLVKGPRFLPAVQGLRDGMAQFKLSCQGLDLLRWECPDIRVIEPVLERVAISHRSNGDPVDLQNAELAFDGSKELWAKPQFRTAPELEGGWAPSESTIYLWRHREGQLAGGQVDVRFLENLQEQGGSRVQAFKVDNPAGGAAVRVMPRRVGLSVFGWPRRPATEKYSLAASVVYRPAVGASTDRMIAEWSDVYSVQLNAPWVVPLCWWPVAVILVAGVITTLLRLLVPNPSLLPLDMRLEENVAVVEPVRLDNPVLVDLQETSFLKDVRLYTRYLRSRWGGSALATVVGPVRVFLRRILCPRRWAWMAVIPRVRGDAKAVRTGLMCVWTGLGARGGRVWSEHDGSQRLPEDGQVKAVHMDLAYRADNVDRKMRVTVRIGRILHRELL